MRQPFPSPSGQRPTPGPGRHRAGGGVFRPLARASCKPHPGSPGATDPLRPLPLLPAAWSLCQPRAHTRSHAHTHTRAACAHTLGPPWRTRARSARTRRTDAGEWRRRRKELTGYRPTEAWTGGRGGEARKPEVGAERGAEAQRRLLEKRTTDGTARAGEDARAPPGVGFPQPLAPGGGRFLDWGRRDPAKGLDKGDLGPHAPRGSSRRGVLVLGLNGALAHLRRCTCPGS